MGIFNFGKKKEATSKCGCGNTCNTFDIEKARFIVLGNCCQKSRNTFENTKVAIAQLGFTDEVLNIGDNVQIAKFGVMQTPALVIDSKVVSYGKELSVDNVIKIIEKLEIK